MTCMNAWLLFCIQTDWRCTELLKSRSVARAVTVALNSASWLAQKAAFRILLAKMLLVLLIRIRRPCLSHTIDKRPKQRKNAIIAISAIIIAVAYLLFVYILHPCCNVINHKNATARVNVAGLIRVKPGFKPGFKPGSRCSCERGLEDRGWIRNYGTLGSTPCTSLFQNSGENTGACIFHLLGVN